MLGFVGGHLLSGSWTLPGKIPLRQPCRDPRAISMVASPRKPDQSFKKALNFQVSLPDSKGRFGRFGGQYVPEMLMGSLKSLEDAYTQCLKDPTFKSELDELLRDYVGRETPLYFAKRMTQRYTRADGSGPQIYLKREDLAHTGAYKINNAIGQVLIAVRLGKTRVIAETGAGQHGVATAAACAKFGVQCIVYMGSKDMSRQKHNVARMRLFGADVREVSSGAGTQASALSEAVRDWATHPVETFFIVSSVTGPHPNPLIARNFQKCIGEEVQRQALERWGGKPDILLACVGGGSNALGLFHAFMSDESVELIGVEAAGHGLSTGCHAASLSMGSVGVLHGAMSYQLQDTYGNIQVSHSISAGLDYPAVGPEHSYLHDTGRAKYVSVTDKEALEGYKRLSRLEGILPALEASHAIAYLETLCRDVKGSPKIVVGLSGTGDKDIDTVTGLMEGQES